MSAMKKARAFRMRSAWTMSLAIPALVATLACGAEPIGDGDGTGSVGTGDGGTGTSTGSTGNTGGSGPGNSGGSGIGGSVKPPELPSDCEGSKPGSRLLRRLTRQELLNTEAAAFGATASGATTNLPGDPVDSIRLSNDASILTMNQDTTQAVLNRAEDVADLVTGASALPNNLPCSSSSPDATCAGEFIKKYGESLFRRPLEQADIDRYLALHQSVSSASDFATGLKWALVGLIQSPHAVYRSELGSNGKLTPYEVASELSYDYAASPPSAALLALAMDGSLDDPEVRYQEAKKLLASPQGLQVMRRFFEEWLTYKNVLTVSRANTPDNFESVRPKMVRETEQFLDKLLIEKSGKLSDLLTANYTYADAEVASYYGFPGGSGDLSNGTAAEVVREFGLGVFAQGSVTTAMASIAITSPTRRGLLLLRRLFCEVPEPPQGLNFDLTNDQVQGNTTRERLENSHLAGPCKECHADFDPLGFGFEHIDHVGRYREDEVTPNGPFPIDATAAVAKLGGITIDGQEQLMEALAESPEVLSCISGTMSRYVYGSSGTCRDPAARTRVMAGETSIVDYLAELAREPHFIERSN